MDNTEKITISIREASKMTGISKSTLYKRSAVGDLPILKIGSRVLIKRADFEKWLDGHARNSTKGVR